jgi:hypothetical protein
MPDVKKNLLPVGALTDMGCVVVFGKYKCWIFTTTKPHKVLPTGHRDVTNGLHRLELPPVTNQQQDSSTLT